MNCHKKVAPIALATMFAMVMGVATSQAAVVAVTGVTGHDGGNWPATLGHLSDMVNGSDPSIITTADTNPGMDISADPTDPATWKYIHTNWQQEWKANSRLDPTQSLNNKIGWAVMDFGSVVANLQNMYLWNVRDQFDTENTATFNVYYSSGVGINALPPMPNSKSTTGDYDFSSGDWTLLNGAGVLNLPVNTANNNTPQLIVALGNISAQYIGIEIITAGDMVTPHRVGLAQVEFTSAPVPEPATLALLGLGGLMMIRRRK